MITGDGLVQGDLKQHSQRRAGHDLQIDDVDAVIVAGRIVLVDIEEVTGHTDPYNDRGGSDLT